MSWRVIWQSLALVYHTLWRATKIYHLSKKLAVYVC